MSLMFVSTFLRPVYPLLTPSGKRVTPVSGIVSSPSCQPHCSPPVRSCTPNRRTSLVWKIVFDLQQESTKVPVCSHSAPFRPFSPPPQAPVAAASAVLVVSTFFVLANVPLPASPTYTLRCYTHQRQFSRTCKLLACSAFNLRPY